jgi:hypothetical protein
MWYKIAQQQTVDIVSQSGQSSLNQNTGIYANYAEMQAMSKALKEGTFAEIDTPSGKILVLHGSQGPNGEFCGQIAPGQSLCGDEFTAWRQQKGYNADQVLTCEGGLLPDSLHNVKAPIQIGIPVAPDPNNPNAPMFATIQRA